VGGDDGADQQRWKPTAAVEGQGGTGVPFPGLLSVGRSAGYVGRAELLGRLERARRQTAVVDAIGDISSQYPDFPAWWITHAVVLAMVGRAQEAHDVLARHAPDPDELINDVLPFMAVSWLAWVPLYLDDAQLAARIAATLRPYRDCWGASLQHGPRAGHHVPRDVCSDHR
jgi:hypothetical protein